jgi:hypothetical protein
MNKVLHKVCFYIMTTDCGFAPNPFHGFCTLAACTPNHRNAHLIEGDLIVGVFRSGKAIQLAYIIEIETIDSLHDYYTAKTDGDDKTDYKVKKPLKDGTRIQQAGDNIYWKSDAGDWEQDPHACYHQRSKDPEEFELDTKYAKVFIGQRFVYYGKEAENINWEQELPADSLNFLTSNGRWRMKYLQQVNDPDRYAVFYRWACSRLGQGRIGYPRDWNSEKCCSTRGEQDRN